MRRILTLLAALTVFLSSAHAGVQGRVIENFDAGWKFKLGDIPAASRPSYNDRSWRSLDLPHDWSIEGENLEDAPSSGRGGYFPTGIGWYRKDFDVPGYSRDRLYSVEFDGVYMNSEVWINGHYLGKWPYGYSSFSYDLTPYLKARGNVIAVRVDNSMQPNSRWYTGSGIYRHVRLVSTDKLHFRKWGVFVYTDRLEDGEAVLRLQSSVENSSEYAEAVVRHELIDAGGNPVAVVENSLPLVASAAPGSDAQSAAGYDVQPAAGSGVDGNGVRSADADGEGALRVDTELAVSEPQLWDTENPYMYTLRSELLVDGQVVDAVQTPVGIRTIEYDPYKGFLLNGRQVKMKGVNLHHDAGAVGAAVPERVWERRIEILKSGGCNAIRTAHNIPSPEFLDLCDKHGMLVMDEAFDQWQAGKNEYDYHVDFAEWWEKDLGCMVMRDRNHPSVVMWSIGNEVPDQSTPEGPGIARDMIKLCHELDPTRLVTSGNDRIAADNNPATEEFLAEFAEDIVGYNYPDRWRTRRETYYTTDKLRWPERRVVATEAGGLGGPRVPYAPEGQMSRMAGGRSQVQPDPLSASFIDTEQRWKYTLINDFVIGDFMWTGIDYYGETRWPSRGASSGYLDNCGFKKDGYWFFKSIWSDEPVLHLARGWNYGSGSIGKIMQVVVFTNCGSVELFVNGKSYGRKTYEFPRKGNEKGWNKRPAGKVNSSTADLHLTWDVEYQPGEVKLVGTKDGKEYVEVFRTAGAPAGFRASFDRDRISADPTDVAHLTVEIVDENGTVVPSAENLVSFSAPGAELIGVESGNMSDLSSVKASERKAYGGMCLAILQARQAGEYEVTVTVEGLGSRTLTLVAE